MRSNAPNRRSLAWLAACIALAGPPAGCTGSSSGVFDRDEDEEEEGPTPTFVIQWNDSHLGVIVHGGGDARSWWMGMAQTDSEDARGAWTGEDCFRGDALATADTGSAGLAPVSYCHPLLPLRTELTYGADPFALVPGEATSLEGPGYKGRMTFYFYDTISEGCWVGGHRTDYYADLCDNASDVIER